MADGRIATTAAATTLAAYPLEATGGSEHSDAVAKALAGFGKALRADFDSATALRDADTTDVFTEHSRETDKEL